MKRLFLSAFAVHGGGGGVLLDALLRASCDRLAGVWLDSRFALPPDLIDPALIQRVPPTMWARIYALRAIARAGEPKDTLLCFNNLPPLGTPRARTITYLHSRLILEPPREAGWSLRARAKLRGERMLLALGRRNCGEFWVQTPGMADLAHAAAPGIPVRVMPFIAAPPVAPLPTRLARAATLFFPADGLPHKNHATLFRAWRLLAREGIRPRLLVSLPPHQLLEKLAEAGGGDGLTIETLGELTSAEAALRLAQVDAVIFPSLVESFGLPLVEARANDVPVLAPERDYVRDVTVPAETFDPLSPRSIADAVRRFLGAPRQPVQALTPQAFVEALVG